MRNFAKKKKINKLPCLAKAGFSDTDSTPYLRMHQFEQIAKKYQLLTAASSTLYMDFDTIIKLVIIINVEFSSTVQLN